MQKINYSHFKHSKKKMKRKVDFTVKGTKLPVIPKGTICDTNFKGYANPTITHKTYENMVSCGAYKYSNHKEVWVMAEQEGYNGKSYFTFPLSRIEALAERGGCLCEEEEAQQQQTSIPHSIRTLLEKAVNLEYNFRTGFDLFTGIDNLYKKTMSEKSLQDLRATVAELNNILNN